MNRQFLAVCLWLGAWLAVSIAVTAGWAVVRGKANPAPAGVLAAAALFLGAVLANAGADLW